MNDVKLWSETKVENNVLYINKEELIAHLLEDEHLKSVDVDIAKPGESVRITPVKDVVEPRVKVNGAGGVFPGVISKVDVVGSGRTHVLKGTAVMTVGKIVGFQEGIIDMCGPGAEYTPFSKTINIVLNLEPAEGVETYAYEKAARMAGLKAATFLGLAGKEVEPDEVEVFETKPLFEQAEELKDLPKVAYVQMLQSQGLLHDTYVYGVDAKQIVPTLLYPTELMDGAILSGNCVSSCDKNTTYHHLNNPVVRAMYEQHGKEINFVGVIITNENVYLADKERSSNWTAKLCEFLNLDGAIVSQEGFGNPDTDLIMNCKKIEGKGVKTVIITDEYAGRDGASQSLADADAAANAVITGGNANETIILPKMDKVIGTLDFVDICAGGFDGSLREDGSIMVELQSITGATNEIGFNRLSATGY
ncbi:MAG: glycine/sarcosine/betaine reductase component B subunit [Parvimonas sp.]|nr:glycine/sarcosine/betaine reductase component B subunit [Parvimonas sp.]